MCGVHTETDIILGLNQLGVDREVLGHRRRLEVGDHLEIGFALTYVVLSSENTGRNAREHPATATLPRTERREGVALEPARSFVSIVSLSVMDRATDRSTRNRVKDAHRSPANRSVTKAQIRIVRRPRGIIATRRDTNGTATAGSSERTATGRRNQNRSDTDS